MRVSMEWLKQYLELRLSPEELAEVLTGAGLKLKG